MFETNLNEASINAKKRNIKNAINVIKSGKHGYNYIKTFAVFTAENPDSQPLTNSENAKLLKKLKRTLSSMRYVYVNQTGVFSENIEHSLFVFNIDLNMCQYLNGTYEQTSFIFGILDDNGNVISQYWEKENKELPYNKNNNPYILKDSSDEYIDASEQTDNYSIIGKSFKYTIPFSIFELLNYNIDMKLSALNENEKRKWVGFAARAFGQNGYNYRKTIFENLLKS